MAFFHPVETDLNLMDPEPLGDLFRDQRAVGEENRPEGIVSESLIHLPKIRVEQGLPSRQEEPQPLNLFKFPQCPLNLFPCEILVRNFSDIAVAALKIAPVGDLELKIPEGRERGRI
jgi:hypothetical protein